MSWNCRASIFTQVAKRFIANVNQSNQRAIPWASFSEKVRGNYNQVSQKDVSYFENLLGKSAVITDEFELETHNEDWLKNVKGASKLMLCPAKTEEVSSILSYCNEQNLAICPQGGNTGLVGGSVPIFDEIIVSTKRMNKIIHFDPLSGALTCEAGCILENLSSFVSEQNYIVPIDLGAKGSCHIGGNISTSAGGLHLIRYGSIHANILGLEAVLPNGKILSCMNTMRKDNTGYDVKRLFIGSEGTLGIVTKVALLCKAKPASTALALLGCNKFEEVLAAAQVIKNEVSEVLSSLEMFDHSASEVVQNHLGLKVPIASHPFYILTEVSGSNSTHNEEKLTNCLNTLMNKNLIGDGTMATDSHRIETLWAIREGITESLLKEGHCYKYDISLPLPEFYNIVEIMREKLKDKVLRCCGYGHLGDGNIHVTVVSRKFDKEVFDIIEPFIFQWTVEKKGSISAEHGIGFKKTQYLHYNKSKEAIDVMKSLKALFDPKHILNPYKVLV